MCRCRPRHRRRQHDQRGQLPGSGSLPVPAAVQAAPRVAPRLQGRPRRPPARGAQPTCPPLPSPPSVPGRGRRSGTVPGDLDGGRRWARGPRLRHGGTGAPPATVLRHRHALRAPPPRRTAPRARSLVRSPAPRPPGSPIGWQRRAPPPHGERSGASALLSGVATGCRGSPADGAPVLPRGWSDSSGTAIAPPQPNGRSLEPVEVPVGAAS